MAPQEPTHEVVAADTNNSNPPGIVLIVDPLSITGCLVAKEVAIYRAHKATPIVVATSGESRFDGAVDVLAVPAVAVRMFVLESTMPPAVSRTTTLNSGSRIAPNPATSQAPR